MTIAIAVKVHSGIVLAADSASTLLGDHGVLNIFTTARKIFNLHRSLPIGMTTWGLGGIGNASIAILAKDLRKRLMGEDEAFKDVRLEEKNYTIEHVANLARQFFCDEHYLSEFIDIPEHEKPFIGFKVAGYSAGEGLPELWQFEIDKGQCKGPEIIYPTNKIGISCHGQPEAITRLINGFSPSLENILKNEFGVPNEQAEQAMDIIGSKLEVPFVHPAMPIQDAIDLAASLVDVSIMFYRFCPGAPTVAGPIDVAAITKYEGFKWVRRKFWYQAGLNP